MVQYSMKYDLDESLWKKQKCACLRSERFETAAFLELEAPMSSKLEQEINLDVLWFSAKAEVRFLAVLYK